jgi:hypothetical protein
MNCQACQIEIEELELGEPLSAAANAHMTACSPCRAFHDERQSLRKLVGGLGTVAAPPDFEFRLRARLASVSNGGSRHFSLRSFLSSAPAVALAATFALLVAGVIIYKQMKAGAGTNQQIEVAKSSKPTNGEVIVTPSPAMKESNSEKENKVTVVKDTGSKRQTPLTASSRNPVRQQPKQANAGAQQLTSNEFSVGGAPRITPSNNSTQIAGSNQLVQLPVRSPMQPVRVSLDDNRGAKRTVTLEPVVFGSQDFTGRNLTRNASPSDIW